MVTDQIADFLTRIRNAGMSRKTRTDVVKTKMNVSIAQILIDEGYIKSFKEVTVEGKPRLRIFLKYENGNLRRPLIKCLKRESRSGLRKYFSVDRMPKVMSGFGLGVISTSKGVISDKKARELGVGGEYLCSVW